MTNTSIKNAFIRFWQYTIAKIGDAITECKEYVDNKLSDISGNNISFDNSNTELTSTTVQGAIKELTLLSFASYIYYDDSTSMIESSADVLTVQEAIQALATRHTTETWTFELEDGSTVTKNVVVS